MTVVDHYLLFLHLDRRMSLNIDLGPLHVHLYSRAVFLMWVTVGILAIAGIAVLVSRKPELIQKWRTWALIAPVVGLPVGLGHGTTAALAAALAVAAVIEYARLVRLGRIDTCLLMAGRAVPARSLAAPIAVAARADCGAAVRTALGNRR